jgi:hypothetical protein
MLVGTFVGFISINLIGMTVVAMNIWGPQVYSFKSFSDAFLSVIFIQLGI